MDRITKLRITLKRVAFHHGNNHPLAQQIRERISQLETDNELDLDKKRGLKFFTPQEEEKAIEEFKKEAS